ncbi:unnamed protein product [Aphanomyces euteiches]|uniref:Uncharacterized protein n=1 Tax=Aphanomyces euteiches TaxID=100861 RepID=A0A6G0WVF3_9STRA|nr:hypothetical protein Ae201684_011132 [Aphanomyces euteiches]KAH9058453.1 hypothetical protein Ae201684P_005796 [Aphanomyces euteiches]KAH9154843.1 hypothetical protein AeRB84_003121 [Aphanomyces euteiches]
MEGSSGTSVLSAPLESDKLRSFASDAEKEELEALRDEIVQLEREFLRAQVKHQFIQDLQAMTSAERFERQLASIDMDASRETLLQRKKELEQACRQRDVAVQQIQDTLSQIDESREALRVAETEARKMDASNIKAREEWKRLQKLNTQKKTALEMTFNVQIPNVKACAEFLDQQAIAMQEDHEKERLLEDKLLDLTGQVKLAHDALEAHREETTRQAGDAALLEQAKKYTHLEDILHWYQEMQTLVEKLSGFRVVQVDGTLFEVAVADYSIQMQVDPETMKLHSVQVVPPTLDVDDLLEIALDENDIPFLLREVRARAANMAQLQAHLELLGHEGVRCEQQGSLINLTFGAPDEEVHVQVEISSEYGQEHEWLQLHAMEPSNDRIVDTINTSVQCRNLVDLIQQIVHQLLQ